MKKENQRLKKYSQLRYAPIFRTDGFSKTFSVELDGECGNLEVVANYAEAGLSMRGLNGHVLSFRISDPEYPTEVVDADALDALLASPKAQRLVRKIRAGYSYEWDGRNNIGCFNEDAQAARRQLQELVDVCSKLPATAGQMPAADYLRPIRNRLGVKANSSPDELSAIAEGICSRALDDYVVLDVRDVLEYITNIYNDFE
jgi:hypothetical protein